MRRHLSLSRWRKANTKTQPVPRRWPAGVPIGCVAGSPCNSVVDLPCSKGEICRTSGKGKIHALPTILQQAQSSIRAPATLRCVRAAHITSYDRAFSSAASLQAPAWRARPRAPRAARGSRFGPGVVARGRRPPPAARPAPPVCEVCRRADTRSPVSYTPPVLCCSRRVPRREARLFLEDVLCARSHSRATLSSTGMWPLRHSY